MLSNGIPKEKRSFFLDCTLGGGGHAFSLLETLPSSVLMGTDIDSEAIEKAKTRLSRFGDRVFLRKENFANLKENTRIAFSEFVRRGYIASSEKDNFRWNGIVADLGFSSDQIEDVNRGFSFLAEARLDMRLDTEAELSAYELVNNSSSTQLAKIFQQGGVGVDSKSLSKAICNARPFETTKQLADFCVSFYERRRCGAKKHSHRHPATVLFQALRIAVNDELISLKNFLSQVLNVLAENGRVAVISFHSLEDKLVTSSMRRWASSKAVLTKMPIRGEMLSEGRLLTSKAVCPSENEIKSNPRARSARLRVFQKQSYKLEVN